MAFIIDDITSPYLGKLRRSNEVAANSAMPIEQPDYSTQADCWLRGYLDDRQYERGCLTNAIDIGNPHDANFNLYTKNKWGEITYDTKFVKHKNRWHAELLLRQTLPTIDQIGQLRLRGIIDDYAQSNLYRRNGVTDGWVQGMFRALTREVAPIQDIIRFSVREAFTPELIAKFGYANEFPSQVLKYAEMQGYGWKLDLPPLKFIDENNKAQTLDKITWAHLYWWSHWELPSLTQGYEMFHRLYSDSRFGRSPEAKEVQFDTADLELLQKAQDIPTYWRKRLQAISYLPLTRVDVRRMYDIDVFTKDEELYHAYRHIGYSDENAWNLTKFTKQLKTSKTKAKSTALAASKLCSYYTTGIVTEFFYKQQLLKLGWDEKQADAIIINCELDIKLQDRKERIKLVRSEYLLGVLDDEDASGLLANIDINPPRIRQYVSLWKVTKAAKRSLIALPKLVDWFMNGTITENELTARMQNLGYFPLDITRTITNAKDKVKALQNQMMGKAIKEQTQIQSKVVKEQEKALEKQKRLQEKAYAKSLQPFTESNLRLWYTQRLLNRVEVGNILLAKGWSMVDADRFLDSIELQLLEKETERANKAKEKEDKRKSS